MRQHAVVRWTHPQSKVLCRDQRCIIKKHMERTIRFLTIPQIFTRARGPLAASAHEVDTTQVRVLIGCVFVEIVIDSETCHICRAVILTI
jgi:hypothetical protein